ncbi:MAG: RNA polymerase sigma factor [Planctomycetes bacterium]|nr:RNA polymerase sigma factor [Planctomycetota bacterium]
MSDGTTTALVQQYANGRRDAFRELHRRLAPRLFAWCALRVPRALQTRLDPDDLTQEIWLRAVGGLPRFDRSLARFRAWLFGIAAHTLAEHLRTLHRRRPEVGVADLANGLPDVPAEVTSVIRQLSRREQLQRLVAAAEALDQDDRRLLLLRGLEELPHAEVARQFGASVDAVEIRWRRLQARLRAQWKAAGFADD